LITPTSPENPAILSIILLDFVASENIDSIKNHWRERSARKEEIWGRFIFLKPVVG
jgi:hypothetical protein